MSEIVELSTLDLRYEGHCVPYVSLGQEEATAILSLMRGSTDKALGILEQARFLVDLLTVHGMSVAEVAQTLSRSKGWVSMRQSLLSMFQPFCERMTEFYDRSGHA